MLETTINAQTKNFLGEPDLAALIKGMAFDKTYTCQIFNLYTDVPLQDIVRFILDYEIPESDFMAYYRAHVRQYYTNPELEEAFAHVD